MYSKSLDDHWQYLEEVFELKKMNQMFAKESTCIFATDGVEYLGHFISKRGMETNNRKIAMVECWHVPRNVKELRRFFGVNWIHKVC